MTIPFDDASVKAVFDAYPKDLRAKLLDLRAAIYETAAMTDGAGQIVECLKWGQPAYLTEKPKSGSTIRVDAVKGTDDTYALFVQCQTTLLADFRTHYPDQFDYQGNRALHFNVKDDIDEVALSHCIGMALTYHRRKKS